MVQRRSRGEGSVVELADGRFQARVTVNGKRRVAYGGSRAEAMAKLRELLAAKVSPEARMPLGAWLTSWLDTRKGKVSPRSWVQLEEHVRLHIQPTLGERPLSDLTALDLEGWYPCLVRRGVSASMQKKVGVTLGSALKATVRHGLIPMNPASLVQKPRVEKEEMRSLSAGEVSRFLQAAQTDSLYPLYVLALDGSMRQGELFALEPTQLDLDAGTVTVLHSLEYQGGRLRRKEVKTKGSRRTLRLTPFTVNVLRSLPRRSGQPVFADTQGGYLRAPNVVRRSFDPILRKSHLPEVRFHDLRHTCASLLLASGVHIKAVSARLGHASVRITLDFYVHLMPGMGDGVSVLQDILAAKVSNKVSSEEGDLPQVLAISKGG